MDKKAFGPRTKRKFRLCLAIAFSWAINAGGFRAEAQCPTNRAVWDSLLAIESSTFPMSHKLDEVRTLKASADRCRLPQDSVYARILHRIGLYEYLLNHNIPTLSAIDNTLEAIRINVSGREGSASGFAVQSYINLGYFYEGLGNYDKALAYFDTTIRYAQQTGGNTDKVLKARLNRVLLFVSNTDYQKGIDESTMGLALAKQTKADALLQNFLNQRSLSYFYQGHPVQAQADADSAIAMDKTLHNDFEMATACKTKAMIYGSQDQYVTADNWFSRAIRLRMKTAAYGQIANDYTDLGNYYQNNQLDYRRATASYKRTLEFAMHSGNGEDIAKAYLNLGVVRFRQLDYAGALTENGKALAYLLGRQAPEVFENPPLAAMKGVLNKHLLLMSFVNKVDAAIHQYKQTRKTGFLVLSLRTALLADSLITLIRQEQVGEQSKLYWRDKTREVFANALEACYFSANPALAFFFMEKSREVLLNDKLNEMGAMAHLPQKEVSFEHQLEDGIAREQSALQAIPPGSPSFAGQQLRALRAREDFENHIRSLENKYPSYYQYKFADAVPSLPELQRYLLAGKSVFVHYFMTDSVAYMLSISSSDAKLIRISKEQLKFADIRNFLQQCADERKQNSDHASFAFQSYRVYQTLFAPLNVPPGRVIICSDDFVLPFEALSRDSAGRLTLLDQYAFSYVYSARSLLKGFAGPPAKGNFIGFAPVAFRPYLQLQELKQSASSLAEVANFYPRTALFTNTEATRHNFLKEMSSYSIVNVFSHASADSNDAEPLLFMQDSVIRLSELQLLHEPATRLIVLSACQTNTGRNASGEGIYSLARGFSFAGIPSVAATLWNADESAIYTISGKFHEYLSRGWPKDIALQKAKLDFRERAGKQGSLPYYWASMVLIGNADPLRLFNEREGWWQKAPGRVWTGPGVFLLFLVVFLFLYSRRKKRRPFSN